MSFEEFIQNGHMVAILDIDTKRFKQVTKLGIAIHHFSTRVTFRVDASSESGEDFFYDTINAPTHFQLSLFPMVSKSQFS